MRAWEPLLFSRQLQLCWTQFKWPFCMLDDNTIEIRERICLHHEIIPLLFKVQLNSQSHHIVFSQNFSILPLKQLKGPNYFYKFWHFSKSSRLFFNFLHFRLKRIDFWFKCHADEQNIAYIWRIFNVVGESILESVFTLFECESFCLGTCMSQCHFVFHFNGPAIEHFCN